MTLQARAFHEQREGVLAQEGGEAVPGETFRGWGWGLGGGACVHYLHPPEESASSSRRRESSTAKCPESPSSLYLTIALM